MAERQLSTAGNPVNDLMAEGEAHDNEEQKTSDPVDDVLAGPEKQGFDFEALDRAVDPSVYDSYDEATQSNNGPEEIQTTRETGPESQIRNENVWEQEDNPYKKRYSDSSREIQKIRDEQKDLKPFVPVLEAMKRDSGLVEHVRDYLQSGGKPTASISERLELPEDFIYDQQEAIENPNSDSAKVFNAHVEKAVTGRVNTILSNEKKNAMQAKRQMEAKSEAEDFRKNHKVTDGEYEEMVDWAKNHKLSIEDIYYLKNKGAAVTNASNNAKSDMLEQMKNVRQFPTSAASVNSTTVETNPDDALFESLLDLDDTDNLFG
tara:strand:- start:12403 stop:13359 length:957 start_codon:yes stop_codon:yes gene_type:complete